MYKLYKILDYKKIFYLFFLLSFITGIIYFILDIFFQIETEFGTSKNKYQFIFLKLHALSSLILMVVFGYFFARHVEQKIKIKNKYKKKSGFILLSIFIILFITAYMLYYSNIGLLRDISYYLHIIFGFLIILILLFHIRINFKKIIIR